MTFDIQQIEELKRYCAKVCTLKEGGVTFFYLGALRLPDGCNPKTCDALLCPVQREGYPSRLYLAVQVTSAYTRNWNVTNARIGEKNWFAFSWRVEPTPPTLAQMLIAHLTGFTKDK
jgi:hypothetical protein